MTAAEIEALRDAAAAMLGLSLSPESAAAVAVNLRVLADRAAEFADVTLAADLDPASLLRL